MNRQGHRARHTALRAAALATAVGLAGCLEYTFETTVEPDGSGIRTERIEVTENENVAMSEADFRALTLTTPERGWSASVSVDEDGDTTRVLERHLTMQDLADWSRPAARTILLGTTPTNAGRTLGYVRLGDVALKSSIQVGVSRRSDGASVISYREAFFWENGVDAMVEFLAADFDRRLAERYPRLTEVERASLVGYARARIRVATEEGLFADDREDEAVDRTVASTAEHAVRIVRTRYPDADVDALRGIMAEVMAVEDEEAARLFDEILPGLTLGFNSNIVYRLELPGHVTTTNAPDRNGTTLRWTFSPLDDPTMPVEIFAESVVGG